MSNGFLRALAKVKLIELDEPASSPSATSADPADDPEIQRMVAEAERAEAQQAARKGKPGAPPARPPSDAAKRAPAAAQKAAPRAAAATGTEIAEGQPFEAYYAQAGVDPAPYPAEKLLRLLDGLRAMDPRTRKSAVIAMDAADDNWAIADVVLDAERKVAALAQIEQTLRAQVAQIVEHAQKEKEKQDSYIAKAAAKIRGDIEKLEQMLEKEIAESAAHKAQLDAQVHAAEAAFQRESVRIGAEQQRLAEIPSTFVIDRPAG
jgi:hypothetical protein